MKNPSFYCQEEFQMLSQVSELFNKRNNLCHHINLEFIKRKKKKKGQ